MCELRDSLVRGFGFGDRSLGYPRLGQVLGIFAAATWKTIKNDLPTFTNLLVPYKVASLPATVPGTCQVSQWPVQNVCFAGAFAGR